ncbi:SCO family protein [Haloarchaeobius amylolyticus]|uniref:SCO family protein n=1 Tax=Haloarchaeobius amylolyticus TaxID=1198296 RepID=UPI00226E97C5|nr:SCO family protein [Haloarchaeobius amylolyticus]
MQRRTFLTSAAAVGSIGGLAGCLGSVGLGDDTPNVALPDPDRPYESSDVAFPAWGQEIPDVTLTAPIADREVALREVDQPALLTFFYSHCKTVCPLLISAMRNVHVHARNEGYADAVSFLPVTFDPERDDAARLQTYSEKMNVDTATGNWHYLRPASTARAKAVVEDQFGVGFQRTEPEDMDMYMFAHSSLTLLVNADGYVERAYTAKSPDEDVIIDDLATVRAA